MKKVLNGIELNEEFVPNHNILYDVFFDGKQKFEARLSDPENKRRAGSFDDAPKVVKYVMDKPLDEFTKGEMEHILAYRGLELTDGFEAGDVFMEFSYVKREKLYSETLTREQLLRRLVILEQVANQINDNLAEMGYADEDGNVNTCSVQGAGADGDLGANVVNLFMLANTNSDHIEKFCMTDSEYNAQKEKK